MNCLTGPHEFRPMKRWFNRGRCMHCYIHETFHPINGWVTSRPWRDFSLPVDVSVKNPYE